MPPRCARNGGRNQMWNTGNTQHLQAPPGPCRFCGGTGHFERDCPNNRNRQRVQAIKPPNNFATSSRPRTRLCKFCQGSHWDRDCPQRAYVVPQTGFKRTKQLNQAQNIEPIRMSTTDDNSCRTDRIIRRWDDPDDQGVVRQLNPDYRPPVWKYTNPYADYDSESEEPEEKTQGMNDLKDPNFRCTVYCSKAERNILMDCDGDLILDESLYPPIQENQSVPQMPSNNQPPKQPPPWGPRAQPSRVSQDMKNPQRPQMYNQTQEPHPTGSGRFSNSQQPYLQSPPAETEQQPQAQRWGILGQPQERSGLLPQESRFNTSFRSQK